jgi:hypothetical protein
MFLLYLQILNLGLVAVLSRNIVFERTFNVGYSLHLCQWPIDILMYRRSKQGGQIFLGTTYQNG